MRHPLIVPFLAATLGLTACTYDPVADAEHQPALPTAAASPNDTTTADRDSGETADAAEPSGDRVVTIAETPGRAPSPAETMAEAADEARAATPVRSAVAEPAADAASEPATPDLTPATNAAEDARQATKDAAEDARSSFDRPVSSDLARDAAAEAGAAEPAGLAVTRGNAENATESTADTADEIEPAAKESVEATADVAAENADAVEAAAADNANNNRTVATDGIEEVRVPVTANATGEAVDTAKPKALASSDASPAAVAAAGVAAAGATAAGDPEAAAPRPNIIFLITDDQHREEFGFLNHGGKALAPHTDALRAGGTHLANHYVSSSVCSPSRYTCLTGQYASRCTAPQFLASTTPEGVTHVMWNQGFVDGQPTLPGVLQDAGYTTGFTGKWHLGFNVPGGFADVPSGADATDPADPGLIATLKENQQRMSTYLQTLGFDYAKNIYGGNPNDSQQLKKAKLNIHHQEWLTQAAFEFIEANQDGPFFLYYAATLTHTPDNAESLERDPRLSPVGLLDEPITGLQPDRADVIRRVKEAGIDRENWGATWLDDGVGALVKKLEDLGLADNTLIVYFDDHGMEYSGKGTLYEGGLVSPTIAYWPGRIPAGGTVEALTQNTDFAPTFMALAGATTPDDMAIDGKNITDLLTGGDKPVRDSVYAEIGLTRSVTTADGWKYLAFRVPPSLERTLEERLEEQKTHIAAMHKQQPWTRGNATWDYTDPEARYSHLGMGAGGTFFERIVTRQKDLPYMPNYFDPDQLYNLNEDPTETTNLAGDPAHAEKLVEMKALLTGYLDELPGTFMDLKPSE